MKRWDWKEAKTALRGQTFAALDPGVHGALIVCGPEKGMVRYARPSQADECAKLLALTGARVMVVESQYITNVQRSRSVIELTLSMGILLGYLSHEFGGGLDVVSVAPSTWQAAQKQKYDPCGQKKSGYAAEMMMKVADSELGHWSGWRKANISAKTGIAAAYGIAQWWHRVTE